MTTTLACLVFLIPFVPSPEQRDAVGDPLPLHAVARLGTDRLGLHYAQFLEFSPDDRLLLGIDSAQYIRVFEVASGRCLWTVPPPRQRHGPSRTAWSADSKGVAVADGAGTLRVLDALTGRELHKHNLALRAGGWPSLQPGGTYLALASTDHNVTVWDLKTGKEPTTWGKLWGVSGLAWTADGKSLIAVIFDQSKPTLRTLMVWTPDRKTQEQHHLTFKDKEPGLLSPDGRWYVMPLDDKKTLELFDPLTGKKAGRIEAEVVLNRIALSRGGRLTAVGADGTARIWELATGKVVHKFEGQPGHYSACTVSTDGKRLATGESSFVTIWDLATRKPLHDFPGHRGFQMTVAFSADGKSLNTAAIERSHWDGKTSHTEWSLRRWDAATGKELNVQREKSNRHPSFLLLSPDARRLAIGNTDGHLELWDSASGKRTFTGSLPTRDVQTPTGNSKEISFWHPAFTSDGRVLVGGHYTGIHRFDVEDNKQLPSLDYPARAFVTLPIPSLDSRRTLFTASTENGGQLVYLDADTKAVRLRLPNTSAANHGVVPSPDGRLVAMRGEKGYGLFELVGGARRMAIDLEGSCMAAVFSADGQLLFLGETNGDTNANTGTIRVIRVATGEVVRRMKEDRRGSLSLLALSPDGKRLASGGLWSSTLLLWDISNLPPAKPAAPLTEKETLVLWNDLRGEGEAAHRAIARLAAASEASIPLMRKQAKLIWAGDKQVAKLIAELDADDFETRERASTELAKLGNPVRDALRAALAGNPSVEVQIRIKALLEKLDKGEGTSPEVLWLRLVELLEAIGSPEARDWLSELVKDGPMPSVSAEAKVALLRLNKRTGK